MKTKITITLKQAYQFNMMLHQLKRIKAYDSPEKIRRYSEKKLGLDFEEAIEMAYENMHGEAQIKGVRPIEVNVPVTAEPKLESSRQQSYSPPDSDDLPIERKTKHQ